ncbi:carbohydrate ABC transporter permease [Microbacterium sp. LTA6]|uniref:carbohydrate ABC transporter permease n=1 Tax=unclassified Microbacterium TaxID=2609290 RepID=UPI00324FD744
MIRSRLEVVIAPAFLIAVAAAIMVPFVAIFAAALQPAGSIVRGVSWPAQPAWGNFARAWTDGGFLSLFMSSAIVAVAVVIIGVIMASLAGYAMGTMTFRGRAAVLAVFLAGLTLPYEVVVVPLFYMFRPLGILDTYFALILPLLGLFMPFGVFWMRTHFDSVPKSLLEAGEIDGANHWQVFWRILMPTARPAIGTLALLFFLWSWNQYLLALILIQDASHRTAPAGLGQFITQHGKDVPLLAAGTIIVMIPVLIVFLIFQRQLIRGFLQGAVKE